MEKRKERKERKWKGRKKEIERSRRKKENEKEEKKKERHPVRKKIRIIINIIIFFMWSPLGRTHLF